MKQYILIFLVFVLVSFIAGFIFYQCSASKFHYTGEIVLSQADMTQAESTYKYYGVTWDPGNIAMCDGDHCIVTIDVETESTNFPYGENIGDATYGRARFLTMSMMIVGFVAMWLFALLRWYLNRRQYYGDD